MLLRYIQSLEIVQMLWTSGGAEGGYYDMVDGNPSLHCIVFYHIFLTITRTVNKPNYSNLCNFIKQTRVLTCGINNNTVLTIVY